MKELDHYGKCPKCGESWDNGTIFEALRPQAWTKKMSDEELIKEIESSYSEPYRFSKLVGIELRAKYDGVSYWQCPFCGATWDRFTNKEVDEAL